MTPGGEVHWPPEGGEAGRKMRAADWSSSPLGPPDGWAQPLRTAIEVALSSHVPMLVAWGQDCIAFYNDAFAALAGGGYDFLGRPCHAHCAQISSGLAGALERACSGETVHTRAEDSALEASCLPLRHRNGAVGGAVCALTPIPHEVLRDVSAALERSPALAPPGTAADPCVEELAAELRATRGLQRAVDKIVDAVAALQGADFAAAQIYDPETQALHLLAHRGLDAAAVDRFAEMPVTSESEAGTACTLAAATGTRVVAEDLATETRFAPLRGTAAAVGFRAIVSTPLLDGPGRLLGVVSTYFREPHRPQPAEQALCDVFTARAAAVLAERLRERALARHEARLQSSLDASRLGTWEWQPERDRLTLDERARGILGLGPERGPATNAAFERRVHSEDVERCREALLAARDPAGNGHFEAEFRWLREDGRQLWIQQCGQVRSELSLAGKPVALVSGTLLDVTDRRASDDALRAASRHKDRFLATLAHELRNPLAPLRYAAELLHGAGREDLNWSREVIDRQVGHLTRLIDDLFDISRITRELLGIQKQRLELSEVVQGAIESCRPVIAQSGQQLIVQLPSEPIYATGDPVRLTQVIVNLLKNASKFTQGEGRIRIKVARQDGEGLVSVNDSGIGISAEDLPRIFDVFYQGKLPRAPEQAGGLGIGLYLAKRLVELHGGVIEAHSDGPGTGSEFVLRLPVEEAVRHEADAPAASSAGAAQQAAASCRVLVVDDDPDSADALARLLRLMGSEVQTAYDGLAAVEAAEQFRPDVVLLDLDMPRLDGYEACRRLRQQPWAHSLRMVALSGWGRREDRERTREAGFDGHLVKPVGRADVEALLEEWRLGAEADRRSAPERT